MPKKPYIFLEHTADLKFKVSGDTQEKLFENAVLAISEYLSPKKVRSSLKEKIKVTGADSESLLYYFIEEMLYLLDAKGFIISKAEVKIKENALSATLYGDKAEKYRIKSIKSPTFSEMYVKNSNNVWEAQVVLDI